MTHAVLPLDWNLWVGDVGSTMLMQVGGVQNVAPDATVVGKAWRRGTNVGATVDLPGVVDTVLPDGAIVALDPDAWLATAAPGDWLVNVTIEGVTFPEGPAGKATVRARSAP